MIIELFKSANRKRLELRAGRERAVSNRHPWIFAGAIARESGPDDAAIADLVDARGNVLASGFHSQRSQIRLRVLTFGDEELTPELIRDRIASAIARRRPFLDDATNAARLVNAEGDDLSGLVIDRYNDLIVIEIANYGLEQIKPLIEEMFDGPTYFKNDLPARKIEGLTLEDDVIPSWITAPHAVDELVTDPSPGLRPPSPRSRGARGNNTTSFPSPRSRGEGARRADEGCVTGSGSEEPGGSGGASPARSGPSLTLGVTIRESGLRFIVEPREGQKTGFFLDQRENRRLARTLASGRRVLNLFSYSGAFGVYAAAGGATSIVNVDISEKAIALARRNHELNGFAADFVVADAFDWIRKTRDEFDLVVCDPPAFARSRADVDRAARGYKDINLYALKHVAPGGMLMTFSCSGHMSLDLFQKVIFSAAHDAGRRVAFVGRLGAGPDHPVSLYCPEGEYLKGFLLEVRD